MEPFSQPMPAPDGFSEVPGVFQAVTELWNSPPKGSCPVKSDTYTSSAHIADSSLAATPIPTPPPPVTDGTAVRPHTGTTVGLVLRAGLFYNLLL